VSEGLSSPLLWKPQCREPNYQFIILYLSSEEEATPVIISKMWKII